MLSLFSTEKNNDYILYSFFADDNEYKYFAYEIHMFILLYNKNDKMTVWLFAW